MGIRKELEEEYLIKANEKTKTLKDVDFIKDVVSSFYGESKNVFKK